jgi:hypothetical protein
MDQEFKPTEETQPIEVSAPNDTSFQVIDVVRSEPVRQSNINQTTEESEPLLEAENPIEETPKPDTVVPEAASTEKKPKIAKKSILRTLLFVLLITILIGAGIAATLWRDRVASDLEKQQTANITSLVGTINALHAKLSTDKTSDTVATTDKATTETSVAPTAAVIASIKAAITSGNTAALEGYMASSVDVLDDFSAATASTPAVATTSVMNAIAAATSPWDFALSSAMLNTYKSSSFGQYFPSNAIVGKSANNKVVSFSFNSNAKISTVLLIADISKLE